jgi:hypothetical protein
MTIRSKLLAAIAVSVAGLALTAGVGIWALSHLNDRFGAVQDAAYARALALQLKFDVTDFNGWQTAYGYDGGKSRPIFLASVARYRKTIAVARTTLVRPDERALVERIASVADDFMRLDGEAWTALRAGRADEVKRLLLGPEIVDFSRAAAAAQSLAALEAGYATREERKFHEAHHDALRLLIVASVVAALFVVILLVTANDLARAAERALEQQPDSAGDAEPRDGPP